MTIRITSKQDGFRRCGVAHPAAATAHRDDAFTAEQLARLQAEPMLIVELLDGEPEGDGKGASPVKGKAGSSDKAAAKKPDSEA